MKHDSIVVGVSDIDVRLQIVQYAQDNFVVAFSLLDIHSRISHDVHIVVHHVLKLPFSVGLDKRVQELVLSGHFAQLGYAVDREEGGAFGVLPEQQTEGLRFVVRKQRAVDAVLDQLHPLLELFCE